MLAYQYMTVWLLVAWLTEESAGLGSIPSPAVPAHSFMEIDHEIVFTVMFSVPLIQGGQLLVTGKNMGT